MSKDLIETSFAIPSAQPAQAQSRSSSRQSRIDKIVNLVVNSLDSPHSQRAYRRALEDFIAWHAENEQQVLNRSIVNSYRKHLVDTKAGSINQRLSAIRKFAAEAELNGLIDANTARGIISVKGIQERGTRAGNWLTKAEAEALINAPDDSTLKGKRDRALLAVLIGCGLRREEAASLTVEHVQQREGRWTILDIRGKRNKVRTVPMPTWAKVLLDRWLHAAGITHGSVFAYVTRGADGKIKAEQTTPQSIMRAVEKYATEIGKPGIMPHDLRRTYAKLARAGGAALEQISITLGHESLETTQRYLGAELDYQNAPADVLGLQVRLRH
jgi:site-specific recombinase XerD